MPSEQDLMALPLFYRAIVIAYFAAFKVLGLMGGVLLKVVNSGKIKKAINTDITPKKILQLHDVELSSYLFFNPKLAFISSEGNAEFTFMNISESADLVVSGNNYTKPFLIDIKVPATSGLIKAIDNNPLGYFQFKYGKKTYKGYLADGTESIQINPMNEQPTTVKLIVHKDSDL